MFLLERLLRTTAVSVQRNCPWCDGTENQNIEVDSLVEGGKIIRTNAHYILFQNDSSTTVTTPSFTMSQLAL